MDNVEITNLKSIRTLYCLTLLVAFSYGFIYLIPLYTLQLHGNAVNASFFLAFAGVSSILLVGKSGFIADKLGPLNLCALSVLVTGIATLILYLVKDLNMLFYFAGLLLGIGWSYFYVAAPIVLNRLVNNENRGKHIGLLAAFIVCGTGLSPIFANLMLSYGLSIDSIYLIPTILLLVLSLIFYIFSHQIKIIAITNNSSNSQQIKHPIKFIFKSNAIYAIIMVFLGACVFSTMMNFQTLYALEKNLDFSVYYACYMISVVGCRFLFSNIFAKKNVMSPTPYLLTCMMLGILTLLFIPSGMNWLYAISAILLGISYGLVYPLIKTHAINSVTEAYRSHAIAYFTLSYFIGVYFFPIISGPAIHYLGFNFMLILLMLLVSIDAVIGYQQAKKHNGD